MTPQRALKIAGLVCEYEMVNANAPEWKSELRAVLAELNALAQRLGG